METLRWLEGTRSQGQHCGYCSSITNRAENTAHDLSSKAMGRTSSVTRAAQYNIFGHTYTAATAPDLKNWTVETAPYTVDYAIQKGKYVKSPAQDPSYSATTSNGASKHGHEGIHYAGDEMTATPNAPSFDTQGLSSDHGTQLHPLESESFESRTVNVKV